MAMLPKRGLAPLPLAEQLSWPWGRRPRQRFVCLFVFTCYILFCFVLFYLFNYFIYLFFWLHRVLVAACGILVP